MFRTTDSQGCEFAGPANVHLVQGKLHAKIVLCGRRIHEPLENMNPGYYVGWFTLALINAGLAQGKARSGLAWFVVSLLLGPLATFLIVVLDRGDAP